MLKIIISGCNGRMGQMLTNVCNSFEDIKIVAGFDITENPNALYPVFTNPEDYTGEADVLVDFSAPAALDGILTFCMSRNMPAVLCATGYVQEQLEKIAAAAYHIPVFRSANMSLGINLMIDLVKKAAEILYEGFDIEIVEKHHNMKVDAPSGTAIMLAESVASALPYKPEYVYDRNSNYGPRGKNEIGISSVRGGTIPGEHEVIFAGNQEVLEIKHTAYSREIFATGAVRAAKFMANVKTPGLYSMKQILDA